MMNSVAALRHIKAQCCSCIMCSHILKYKYGIFCGRDKRVNLISCVSLFILSSYTEPCRDPDLCQHFETNQPDTSPDSQCVAGHSWGENTNVVTMFVFVPRREQDVCISVIPCYVCGVDEVSSLSAQLLVCICENNPSFRNTRTGQEFEIGRMHNGANTWKNGCACRFLFVCLGVVVFLPYLWQMCKVVLGLIHKKNILRVRAAQDAELIESIFSGKRQIALVCCKCSGKIRKKWEQDGR